MSTYFHYLSSADCSASCWVVSCSNFVYFTDDVITLFSDAVFCYSLQCLTIDILMSIIEKCTTSQ